MHALWIAALLAMTQAPQRVAYNGVEFVANNVVPYSDGSLRFQWTADNVKSYYDAKAAKDAASKLQPERDVPPSAGNPVQPPTGQAPGGATDYGVDPSKLKPKGFSAPDAASKAFAEKVQKQASEDPNSRLHLTFIGTDQECRAPMEDLGRDPNLSPLRGRVAIQEYRPDGWAVNTNLGFRRGNPAVYLQDAKGKVLYRDDKYPGPEKLAEAIRKADPKYNPDIDPGAGGRPTCPLGFNRSMWPAIVGAALFCIVAWKYPRTGAS